ncbi:glycosyltransferase [Bradyrhizobium sp. AUGA SZCCT0274]|uniref:glycosyltransferase family protein n=1 Tax=Bradyrhizobium sp. AUGA SZCCT0274 TaxID=2807670 RepID=UPI001BAE39A7|nr:glycosyltransferase [Bradyrhizobium sp. AUGA SZCCT0274]MBR1244189.1 glycosyltransferase [Bradyrhizobium sp. AUGA SZCCT0274]
MKKKTLYLDMNGTGRVVLASATLLRGLLGLKDGSQPPNFLKRSVVARELYAHLRDFNERLSYVRDWRDAFCRSSALDVTICDMNNLVHLSRCLVRIRSYDLIVVSHVAAGDDMTLINRFASMLSMRSCPMVVFIGNEYDLLDQKLDFCRRANADLLCSQLPIAAAEYLYGQLGKTEVMAAPHALNPSVYSPAPHEGREFDVGFVGDIYWPFVGDRERTDLIEYFEQHGQQRGLRCDIRGGRSSRIPRDEWASFLNRCRTLIGAESGTYYLNEKGALLERARTYNLKENQDASFELVFEKFFAGVPRGVSGKSISSRHFEAIGTKTCQVLIEGDYNGILKAGEHYIPVKSDLSDIDEAIRALRDQSYCRAIADRAHDLAMSGHTYDRRVTDVLARVI